MLSRTHDRILGLCYAAMIAALYVALTYLAQMLGLASGAVQFRLSEALCILPFFTPWAIPGLYVGCLLANLLTGCAPLDIAIGPIATLIGAVGAYLLGRLPRKWGKWLVPIPNILANTVIVTVVVYFCYTDPAQMTLSYVPVIAGGVALGEVVTGYGLGMALLLALKPFAARLFGARKGEAPDTSENS